MRGIKFLLVLFFLLAATAQSKLVTKTVEYRHGDTVLEGYLAHDDSFSGKRPGVLVVHEWYGLGQHVKTKAEKLAKLGYVAFAADIYGKGIRPATNEEAAKVAGQYRGGDRKLLRERALAGFNELRKQASVDAKKTAAIGFCFGGTTVLELARSGAELDGVVSFHGGLDTPNPGDAKNIKCKVLVLHGGDDPNVPPEKVLAFEEEMRQAGVDWQLIAYGGAVHSFTNPGAGNDNSKGTAYNQKADHRSWQAMQVFFNEIFK
ncbi:MAG: dienelactone hydrolase [candidate division Zixibacteria bacterium RBG_16_50_21]|nr:MAG: dienelactone hydrolase [candidate division Zixibacteria bacterium RBG_16_50_21]